VMIAARMGIQDLANMQLSNKYLASVAADYSIWLELMQANFQISVDPDYAHMISLG
jgi:hypothetical protein